MKILKETHDYDDIIAKERPRSLKHPPMAAQNRAAQFSPFAALTGYEEAIEETARLTEEKRTLSEVQQEELDERLAALENAIAKGAGSSDGYQSLPEARITYFVPDSLKAGGKYVTVTGIVRRIDRVRRRLVLSDRSEISLDDIWEIEPPL